MTNTQLIGIISSAVFACLRSYFDAGIGSSELLYPLGAVIHLVKYWSLGLAEPRNSGGFIIGGVVDDVVPSYWKPRKMIRYIFVVLSLYVLDLLHAQAV